MVLSKSLHDHQILHIYFLRLLLHIILGIEIGMKESLDKLKEIIGRLKLKEGISNNLVI